MYKYLTSMVKTSWMSNLYTLSSVIKMVRGLLIFFYKRLHPELSTVVLVRLAELVLTFNDFSFDGEDHKQIFDEAISSKMIPQFSRLIYAL